MLRVNLKLAFGWSETQFCSSLIHGFNDLWQEAI